MLLFTVINDCQLLFTAIKPKGDIVVEVGSSYEAYCLFNPEEVQVKDVYFESTGDDGRRIPHTVSILCIQQVFDYVLLDLEELVHSRNLMFYILVM